MLFLHCRPKLILPVSIKSICHALIQVSRICFSCWCFWCYNESSCFDSIHSNSWIDFGKFAMQTKSNEFSIKCGKFINIYRSQNISKFKNVSPMNFVYHCLSHLLWLHHFHRWWHQLDALIKPSKNRVKNQPIESSSFVFSSFYLVLFDWIDNSIHKYLLDFHMLEQRFMIKMHECKSRWRYSYWCCVRDTVPKQVFRSRLFCRWGI